MLLVYCVYVGWLHCVHVGCGVLYGQGPLFLINIGKKCGPKWLLCSLAWGQPRTCTNPGSYYYFMSLLGGLWLPVEAGSDWFGSSHLFFEVDCQILQCWRFVVYGWKFWGFPLHKYSVGHIDFQTHQKFWRATGDRSWSIWEILLEKGMVWNVSEVYCCVHHVPCQSKAAAVWPCGLL